MTSGYDDVFMQEIRESPADDLPRLIYADWLEDNGQPERAEFIRLQIHLARADEDEVPPRLWNRERELLRQHGDAWRSPLSSWVRGWMTFRRGFPHEYNGTASALFSGDDVATLFRLAPCPVLRLNGATPAQIRRLRNTPHLAHLGGLELHSNYNHSDADLLAVLQLEKAVRLTELGLSGLRWDEPLRQLLEASWVRRLERLALVNCRLGDDSLDHLLGWLSGVKLLDLRLNLFSAGGIERLRGAMGDRVRLSASGA